MRHFRVAMVAACPFPARRGTPVRIYRIAEALARRGHAVDVFTYHIGETTNDEPFRIHRIIRVPTYRKQDPGPSYQKLLILDPLLAVKIARTARKTRYDIIHAHHYEGLLASLPSRALGRIPIVFDMHTLLEAELPSYALGLPKSLLSKIGRFLDRRLPPKSNHVIAVSDEIRANYIQGTGRSGETVSVIPNGVEDFFFDYPKRAAQAGGGTARRLVYAGNFAAYQGINLLLQAFAAARKVRPDLRLQLLTNSSWDHHESEARELGVHEFIDIANPDPEQLAKMLAEAAVAANPRSECSGMPQKLLNYMAAGCAIVSCAGSAKHLNNGKTGLVVANGDVTAFCNAILRLLDDDVLADRLGTNAQDFVRKNMSWDHAATSIEAVYDRLTQESQRIR